MSLFIMGLTFSEKVLNHGRQFLPPHFGTILQLRLKIYAFNLLNTEIQSTKNGETNLANSLEVNTFVFEFCARITS